MRIVRFCFLSIVIVSLSLTLSYAQSNTLTVPKDKGVTAKQLENTPPKPAPQSRPGVSVNTSKFDVGVIMLTNLSVGPDGSGTNNRRLCPLTIRNTSARALPKNYMMKYWSRAGSSAPWDHYYGCTMQWDFPARSTKTIDLHVPIPSGATDFRVTLHESPTSPAIIAEISAPVM